MQTLYEKSARFIGHYTFIIIIRLKKVNGGIDMKRISESFFTGINYWGSKEAINMWQNFDSQSIENDLKLLKNAGITHLRIFPLWSVFQPLTALYGPHSVYEYSFGEEPLPDTPAGKAGVSEEACQKFEKFCRLAEKYDIKLIVAMITGHMSFRTYNPPAFDGKELLSDPTVIKWQIRFVRYFVERFKNEKSIIGWDLGNEPVNMPGLKNKHRDTFYIWCSIIAYTIKICDSKKPVISGIADSEIENAYSNLKDIGGICDIHTTHPYNIFSTNSDPVNTMKPILDLPFKCALGESVSGIETFVQEFSATGYMNCSKKTEADFYRASLFACLSHDCHGTMWWCAFDQGHHNYAPYRWNTIGSDYGFFDKTLREKPIVAENIKFKKILQQLPEGKLPKHNTNAAILIPRDDGGADKNILRTSFMLAKQANMDIKFSYLLDPIIDSPLYIIPSIKTHKSIPKNRLDELLQKVRNGAVLYLCADTGLLRQIPEITGVEFSYREGVNSEKFLNINGEQLPIKTEYFYKPESITAQIIGTDENGEGVFFKHKMGKGYVYFLTLPLESCLANKHGAFFKDDQPPYDLVYRELAKCAGVVRICDSDNPYIRLTEHAIDENSLYVVAINYSNKEQTAKFLTQSGYKVFTVFGEQLCSDRFTLKENDGIILRLEK